MNIQTIYIIKCMSIPMHDLPLLYLSATQHLQHHVWTCECMFMASRRKKTLIQHMRDKQQIKHVKQGLRYMYTYEKGLNKGKICEKNKPNKIRNPNQGFWAYACVSRQRPAYVGFNLRTHAYDMHVWDCSKTPNKKHET